MFVLTYIVFHNTSVWRILKIINILPTFLKTGEIKCAVDVTFILVVY